MQRCLPGTTACDICGRTILAGEKISRLRRDERLVAVCSLCEASIQGQGFVRAARLRSDDRALRSQQRPLAATKSRALSPHLCSGS